MTPGAPRIIARATAVILVGTALAAVGSANDRVKLVKGGQSTGKIVQLSATEVVLEIGSNTRKFPVNEIELVQFDGEPNELAQARIAVRDGRFEDAVKYLARIDAAKLSRPEVAKDADFYRALTAGRLALAGQGSKVEAGKKLLAIEKGERNSIHYFETCQVLGDLLSSLGKHAEAETFYTKIGDAPWPDYRMRSGVLAGRALLGQKQFERAASKFEAVAAANTAGSEADGYRLDARLGKAAAMAGGGRIDEAVQLVDGIIAQAEPENLELHARAYNVLGNCYRSAGKSKEALLAFLHVDLLYSRFADLHAEALANLGALWDEVDQKERAEQARRLLKEKYPTSVWAAN